MFRNDEMIPFTGTPQSWNELIASLPLTQNMQQSHHMQTWQWSQVKARSGWQLIPLVWQDGNGKPVAAAMVLRYPIPVRGLEKRICILNIWRGPLLDWDDAALRQRVLDDLRTLAKRQGAIYIKIDPDVSQGMGVPGSEGAVECIEGQSVCSDLKQLGWQYSKEQVDMCNTILIDLTASEDEMLARMKRQTRQNLRVAQKEGVTVRFGTEDDFPVLYRMYEETAIRDGFNLYDESHYQFVWRTFMSGSPSASGLQPFMETLIAEVDSEPVAAVTVLYFAGLACGLYGMRRDIHSEKRPNYLLYWEILRRAKALNCKVYDTFGVSDVFTEGSRLWSVYRFKVGLGGIVFRSIGAWDFTPHPFLYKMYIDVLPFLKHTLHFHGPPYTNLEERHAKSQRKKQKEQGSGH
jgi:peptidoglycan pentaglycine glycine transferase (the first glycine)